MIASEESRVRLVFTCLAYSGGATGIADRRPRTIVKNMP